MALYEGVVGVIDKSINRLLCVFQVLWEKGHGFRRIM